MDPEGGTWTQGHTFRAQLLYGIVEYEYLLQMKYCMQIFSSKYLKVLIDLIRNKTMSSH